MPPGPPNDAGPDELAALQNEFPGLRVWREIIGERVRYVARSLRPGLSPHTIVTADVNELRAELEPSRPPGPARADHPSTPKLA